MGAALLLSLAIVVYNNAINRWDRFHGGAYVPTNLAFGAAVAAVAIVALDLSTDEIGLRADASDVVLPLLALALFGVVAFGIALSNHASRIADQRVAGKTGTSLAHYVLVRIPLGTALTEELLFRGVLFAAWRDAGASPGVAAVSASVAFGLWHFAPTVIGVRINDPNASATALKLAVLGAIAFTTIAGLALTWLRVETGGLLAPIVLHAGINSLGALAATTAHRRASSGE